MHHRSFPQTVFSHDKILPNHKHFQLKNIAKFQQVSFRQIENTPNRINYSEAVLWFLHLRNDYEMKRENSHHFFQHLKQFLPKDEKYFSTLRSSRLTLKWTSAVRYHRFCTTPSSPTKLITKIFSHFNLCAKPGRRICT